MEDIARGEQELRHTSVESRPSTGRLLRLALPALLLLGSILIPSLSKPFTIDDTTFLKQSEHALLDPLHPTAFDIVWDHDEPDRWSREMVSGPVMSWLLVPTVVSGGREIVAHGIVLLFGWMLVLSTVALAARLGLSPGSACVAGLLLAATPAVLGMAATAMADVPAAAFGVVGLERLLAWKERPCLYRGLAAAGLLTLSALTRSHLVGLVGVGALFIDERPRWRYFWPLALVLPGMFAVFWLTRDVAAQVGVASAFAARLRHVGYWRTVLNGLAFTGDFVLVVPLAHYQLLTGGGRRLASSTLVGTAVAAVLLVSAALSRQLWTAPIAGLGMASDYITVRDAISTRSASRRALSAWLFLAAPAILYVHLPPKYLVASAPAVAILCAGSWRSHRTTRLAVSVVLLLGALLGGLIIGADTRLATVGQRAAAELVRPSIAAGHRVWFDGHWGFHYYAEREGAKALTASTTMRAGDRVVVNAGALRGQLLFQRPCRTRIAAVEDVAPGGRIMSVEDHAGLYSPHQGYPPWSWSASSVIDGFELWEIGADCKSR